MLNILPILIRRAKLDGLKKVGQYFFAECSLTCKIDYFKYMYIQVSLVFRM